MHTQGEHVYVNEIRKINSFLFLALSSVCIYRMRLFCGREKCVTMETAAVVTATITNTPTPQVTWVSKSMCVADEIYFVTSNPTMVVVAIGTVLLLPFICAFLLGELF